MNPHELCVCGHAFEDHNAGGCHYERPKYLPKNSCRCKQFFWIEAAPEVLEASKASQREFAGLAAYLGTCAEDVIIGNLKTTIASLEAKSRLLDAALRKAEGEMMPIPQAGSSEKR